MHQLRTSGNLTGHSLLFAIFGIFVLPFFGQSLENLLTLSLRDDRYSHIAVIPFISAFLIYLQRKRIFANVQYSASCGLPLLAGGIALFCVTQIHPFAKSTDELAIVMLAIMTVFAGGFALCYGAAPLRAAAFPILLLLLMIPIPTVVLDEVVLGLQKGSAVMTYALLKLLGVPVLWQRFKFLLPGVEIEIASECSGIRSSLALFITSIVVGYVFLQSVWKKAFFSFFTVPVVIFKNAVRIVTISCLGVYVDPSFFHGKLHRYGGLPFSLVSLAILVPILLRLHKNETELSSLRWTHSSGRSYSSEVPQHPLTATAAQEARRGSS